MPTYPVETKDGRTVYVPLDRVPIGGLKALNAAIDVALASGRYSDTPPEPSLGQQAVGALRGAVGGAAPMAGIITGSVRGAQMGAPLGPWGMAAGGLGGAMLGGITGMAGSEAFNLATGQPPRPTGEVMRDVVLGGAQAGLESTPPGALAGGARRALEGDLALGALQAGAGVLGLPQTGRMLGQMPTITSTIRTSVRANTARAAQRLGIDLTAAEQSGAPFLEAAEAVLMRTGGSAGRFRTLGATQNAQAMGAAEDLVQQTTGEALHAAAVRGHRFAIDLTARLTAMKRLVRAKEGAFTRAAGPDSSVDVTPAVNAAAQLGGELPKTPSLVSGRLAAIIDDLIALGVPIPGQQIQSTILGPTGAPLVTTIPPQPNITTLAEVRRIRTALGEFAYPSGQAIPEVPRAQAQKLYGALTETLDDFAASRGPSVLAKWQEARESTRRLHAVADGSWYADILDGTKSLPDFSRKLFTDMTMLRDAKVLTSNAGWKMIQQQYWDDALFHSGNLRTIPDGQMILGRQFGDRIAKDQAVIKELFGPESAAALNDLAAVLRTAEPTMSVTRNRAFTTGLVELFQSRAIGQAVTGGTHVASALTASVLPYLMGKALTNPTTARMIAGAARDETLGWNTAHSVIEFLIRAGALQGSSQQVEQE